MKTYLPAIVAILYLLVAIDHFRAKEYGWSVSWLAYSVANLGLILAAKGI
jgi:hypothetical protein